MGIGRAVLDAWAIGVVLSLISIGLFFVAWAGVAVLTVARDRRRARRRRAELGVLRHWYPEGDLAQLDQALERILAEEHGTLPRSRSV